MSRWMDEAYSNVSKLLIHCKPYTVVKLRHEFALPGVGMGVEGEIGRPHIARNRNPEVAFVEHGNWPLLYTQYRL